MEVIFYADEYVVHVSTIDGGLHAEVVVKDYLLDGSHVEVGEKRTERRPHCYAVNLDSHLAIWTIKGSFSGAGFEELAEDIFGDGKGCGVWGVIDAVANKVNRLSYGDIREETFCVQRG